ncbi:MAG: DUF983 domain-containing protein [Thermomicrobiales bacterium]
MSVSPPVEIPLRTEEWKLPKESGPRFRALISRAFRRVCPYCGQSKLFKRWFNMNDQCPHCGVIYNREDGYFLGAFAMNLVIAEFLGMGAVVVLLLRSDLSLIQQEVIAIGVAVLLPVLFYPFSRTLWMALDLFFDKDLTRQVVTGARMWKK